MTLLERQDKERKALIGEIRQLEAECFKSNSSLCELHKATGKLYRSFYNLVKDPKAYFENIDKEEC